MLQRALFAWLHFAMRARGQAWPTKKPLASSAILQMEYPLLQIG
ncbi:Unknown protein sequence [Pseudomonas amygdali pv. lachrymans]|nr:Unknown protein sequence [Pseudomonas amygdali pv. lachrymans]